MPRYGIHAFTLEGDWNNQIAAKTIAQAAELGFDFLEIPILKPDEFDSAIVAKALRENKIEGVASLCLPKDAHLPFNPSGALTFLKKAVDRVAGFGGKQLLGCIYCNLGTLTKAPPTEEEYQKVADVLGELHRYARPNPDLSGATCLWRTSKSKPLELATRGLKFLQQYAAKYALA